MTDPTDPAGIAALSVCEALLLAMRAHQLLPEREIVGLLRDAAETHEKAVGSVPEIELHRSAAVLINRIIAGDDPVGR